MDRFVNFLQMNDFFCCFKQLTSNLTLILALPVLFAFGGKLSSVYEGSFLLQKNS